MGIQIEPADIAAVPPTNSVFSISSTRALRIAQKSAAAIPAAPCTGHDNIPLFVPLGAADIADSLRTLKDAGVLGLVIRQTWMGHGGRHVAEAVVQYGEADCTRAGLADLKSGK